MTSNNEEDEMVPFISWRCRCSAHGNVEASKPSKRYRLHRGRMHKGVLRTRPGHGLVEFRIYDQLSTDEVLVEPAS